MPLNTEILRKGKPRKIGWGQFHVAAMTMAAALDSESGELYEQLVKHNEAYDNTTPLSLSPSDAFNIATYHVIAATPLNNGNYVMKKNWTFIDLTDDEHFELKKGDKLVMWRD